jgi:hypothetical protein
MEDPSPAATPEPLPPASAPPQRNGCLTAFLVLVGVILLLPGLCTGFFSRRHFRSDSSDRLPGGLGRLRVDRTRAAQDRPVGVALRLCSEKAPTNSAGRRKMLLDLARLLALCHCFLAFSDYIAPQCMRYPVRSAGFPFWGKAPLLSPGF